MAEVETELLIFSLLCPAFPELREGLPTGARCTSSMKENQNIPKQLEP